MVLCLSSAVKSCTCGCDEGYPFKKGLINRKGLISGVAKVGGSSLHVLWATDSTPFESEV